MRIVDQGPGVAPGALERFSQPSHFTHQLSPFERSGLGLIIVGHMMRAHQGTLAIANLSGVGAEVTLTFRLEDLDESVSETPKAGR